MSVYSIVKHFFCTVVLVFFAGCTSNAIVFDQSIPVENSTAIPSSEEEAAQSGTNEDDLLVFMVYGKSHIVGVTLPNTWTVDMDYARQAGINAFFYTRNNPSAAAIILNLAGKPKPETKLDEWIEYDISEFHELYDDLSMEKTNWQIQNKHGYRMEIYMAKDKNGQIIQYSAYIDADLGYFSNLYITLRTNDDKLHRQMLEDFKICLTNTQFLNIGIILQNN